MFWVLITRLLNCFNNMKEYKWLSCLIQTHSKNSTRQITLYIMLCCLSYVFEIIITYYFWTDKNWSLELIHIFQHISSVNSIPQPFMVTAVRLFEWIHVHAGLFFYSNLFQINPTLKTNQSKVSLFACQLDVFLIYYYYSCLGRLLLARNGPYSCFGLSCFIPSHTPFQHSVSLHFIIPCKTHWHMRP